MTTFDDTDSWNTPAPLVALVRDVMGGIDVDPASNAAAQAVVQATMFYTLETNGLAHEWPGRVYANPPYSNVEPFVAKLFVELDAGRTTEAIALVNARSSSAWFQSLAARAWRCELRQRVKFWRPERPEGSAGRQASVVFYVGPDARRFARVFRPLGIVTRPASGIRDTKPCVMCGEPVRATRSDAATCSARCRKRLERRRKSGPPSSRAA
ncbi:MAG TPA: DNA N-6-adenine-methyltransferase [Polyangiaceae bacterium]|nr:DNA N-6-adenine-methyltransferase [Polyangiaceae bacterium]